MHFSDVWNFLWKIAPDPFSDARLSLKQVDVSALGETEQYVLNATLGSYGFEYGDQEIAESNKRLSETFGGTKVFFDSSTARRFAGDNTLPRARYFSLSDQGGFDGRTLLQELSAYLTGSSYPGLVSLFETDGQDKSKLSGVLAAIPERNHRALNLRIPSLLIAVRPLAIDHVLADVYGSSNQYVIQVPYQLTERTVAGVLDLREPNARAWLIDQFNGKIQIGRKRFPVMLGRKRLSGFEQLLPSLLDQWLGGGWTIGNLIGIFARQAGASGLVYPSARSNAWVELRDNAITNFSGWCFVSYEGAPRMAIRSGFSNTSGEWPTRIGWSPHNVGPSEFIPLKNVEISHSRTGISAGSFTVQGLAEYNWAVYRLSQVNAVLRGLDAKLGRDVSVRLDNIAANSPAEHIEWISKAMYGALLGVDHSMTDLTMVMMNVGSDHERDTLADVLQFIALVPPSFHASGALAEALEFS